jgi:hypothetical protein
VSRNKWILMEMEMDDGNTLNSRASVRKCEVCGWSQTYHECLKVRAIPLRDTVADLPIVVDAVRVVELSTGRSKALVKTAFKALNIVFTRLQVVPRSTSIEYEQKYVPKFSEHEWPALVPSVFARACREVVTVV